MATVEWTRPTPFILTSPRGNLALNEALDSASDGVFLLDQAGCSAGPALRVFTDDAPQSDGSYGHPTYKGGYTVRLRVEFWETIEQPACGQLLREMWDLFMLHVNALVRPSAADLGSGKCRLRWTPTGYGDDRMYDRLELIEWPVPSYEEGVLGVTLSFRSPLPYAIDLTQHTTTLNATITNLGTADYWPVFKVYGPYTSFTIINTALGVQIGYDSSQPGAAAVIGGDYAEIACFDNTVFLNGNSTNLMPGIYIPNSDFFPLAPGANPLTFASDGGTCDVLWNHCWA